MKTKLTYFSLGLLCGLAAWVATDRILAHLGEKRYRAAMAKYDRTEVLEDDPVLDLAALLDIEVRDAKTGEVGTMGRSKDRVIFLNLWATWCNPCIREMPSIASLRAQVGAKVDFYLVSNEEHDLVSGFAEGRDDDLPFYSAAFGGTTLEALAREGIPRTFVIHDGRVVIDHLGAAPWDSQKVLDRIEGL